MSEPAVALAVLLASIVMFATERIRVDVVALLAGGEMHMATIAYLACK